MSGKIHDNEAQYLIDDYLIDLSDSIKYSWENFLIFKNLIDISEKKENFRKRGFIDIQARAHYNSFIIPLYYLGENRKDTLNIYKFKKFLDKNYKKNVLNHINNCVKEYAVIHTDISVLRNNIIAHRKFNSDRQFILKEYQLSEKTIEKAYSILMNCLRNISENCENIFSLDTKNNLFKFNISTQAEYLMSQVYSLNEEKSISKHFFPYHTEA